VTRVHLKWIHVHVVQLFDKLLLTPHVEIMKPWLRQEIASLAKLPGIRFLARFAPEAARDALFEDLHSSGRRNVWRLADQQADVLGHDDVTSEFEFVRGAHFADNRGEGVLGSPRRQERQAAVATAGDEMQVRKSVTAVQPLGHGEHTKSPALQNRKDGAPERQNRNRAPES